MRKVRNLVLVILLAGLLVFPVNGQEATPEATPTSDPVVVVTNEQNTADVIELVVTVVAVGFGAFVLGYQVFVNRNASAIAEMRANRMVMEKYEKIYADADQRYKVLFDTAVDLFGVLAPLIPGTVDDDLLDFLEDIQEPGEQK